MSKNFKPGNINFKTVALQPKGLQHNMPDMLVYK